jgi:hypothetical protein
LLSKWQALLVLAAMRRVIHPALVKIAVCLAHCQKILNNHVSSRAGMAEW